MKQSGSPHLVSDIDHIDKGLYCIDEVKVINQIANIYSKQGKREQALQIFVQLIDYIKQHFQNVKQSGGLLPLGFLQLCTGIRLRRAV